MGNHQVQESDPADATQPAMSHSLEGAHSVAVPNTDKDTECKIQMLALCKGKSGYAKV